MSLLEKGGAARGYHPAIVPVGPTPVLRDPSSHPPAPLPSSWAALAGEVHSPSLPSGILVLPVERSYPETEDSFRILPGPFSPPQSCGASAALYEQWPGCATTPAVPAAETPPECGSSPTSEDCNPGI